MHCHRSAAGNLKNDFLFEYLVSSYTIPSSKPPWQTFSPLPSSSASLAKERSPEPSRESLPPCVAQLTRGLSPQGTEQHVTGMTSACVQPRPPPSSTSDSDGWPPRNFHPLPRTAGMADCIPRRNVWMCRSDVLGRLIRFLISLAHSDAAKRVGSSESAARARCAPPSSSLHATAATCDRENPFQAEGSGDGKSGQYGQSCEPLLYLAISIPFFNKYYMFRGHLGRKPFSDRHSHPRFLIAWLLPCRGATASMIFSLPSSG